MAADLLEGLVGSIRTAGDCLRYLVAALVLLGSAAGLLPHQNEISYQRGPELSRRLYVTDGAALGVYDIDRGHRLLRAIPLPHAGEFKGIGASARLGLLYLTAHQQDELLAVDLLRDTIAWRRHVDGYPDNFSLSPDGLTLYLPLRAEGALSVMDAHTGEERARIVTERGRPYTNYPNVGVGPHNTWVSPDGSRVYLEILSVPYLYVIDTPTDRILGKIGPFSSGVRPFTISSDERRAYATVDGLLGFEQVELRPRAWGGEADECDHPGGREQSRPDAFPS